MACTSFVGTPASLRAPAATRSARARVSVRADASSAATCVVTPATVGSRSGSASVKGTVRKQNEDRFASYVRPPPALSRDPDGSPRSRSSRRSSSRGDDDRSCRSAFRRSETRRHVESRANRSTRPRAFRLRLSHTTHARSVARFLSTRTPLTPSSPHHRHHKNAQINTSAPPGAPYAIYGVYDGHGGFAVSEWLAQNLASAICEEWPKADFCLEAISAACLKSDYTLIQPPGGFLGAFGERGVGGAKCGSTAVVAVLFEDQSGTKLCTANVGDARTLLVRDGKAVQLSVDHVPDDENERRRIDAGNPNLRKSLVTFTEGSWRVGGVLALSRAFGDAFLKESGKFEGFGERNADYGSGFGLNAEPDCYIEALTEKDTWVMMSSDGLFANDARGGGGGFENQEIADFLLAAPADATPESLAKELCSMAVAKGSTDDITVTLMKL